MNRPPRGPQNLPAKAALSGDGGNRTRATSPPLDRDRPERIFKGESGRKMVLMGMARYLELRKAEIQMERYQKALSEVTDGA